MSSYIPEQGTVRLYRRSEQGIIGGLNGWQVASLAIAGAVLWLSLVRWGIPGAVISMVLALPIAAAGLVPFNGMPLSRYGYVWLSLLARRKMGATQTRFRPERVAPKGTIQLPGKLGNVQIWEDPENDFAVVYDPRAKTMSLTAELQVQGFLMMEPPERAQLMEAWSRVLASFTQREGIKRVTLQERTAPMTVEPARQHYRATVHREGLDPHEAVATNYQEALESASAFAVSHRNYLTLTFDLIALHQQVGRLGGGREGILALARQEKDNITAALRDAQFTIRRWLNVRLWAGLARTAFDPDYLSILQNRVGADEGVDLAAIGPMALEEPAGKNGLVYTDSGYHTTMWVNEWPKMDMPVGFVEPIVFARDTMTGQAVSHIFTIVMTPVRTRQALKRIRDEKKTWRNNQRVKAKSGQSDSAADVADWEALLDQETAIVQGEGDYRYGAYVTVSAKSEEELESALAGMRNALNRANMEAQILYCQQAEALLVNALPTGQGMK
jgi:hypothetical protein